VVNSALRYRAQAPLLDSILKEVGLSTSDISGLTAPLTDFMNTNTDTTSESNGAIKLDKSIE
jgi:hypothetical protein